MKKADFTKEEMIDFLSDYANNLYNDNPPESIFDDNSQYIRDFVDGYFEGLGIIDAERYTITQGKTEFSVMGQYEKLFEILNENGWDINIEIVDKSEFSDDSEET